MADDTPIPAATVVLLRDEPRYEVLMVERRESMAFAGGALVFPGGRVDPSDADPAWRDHALGLDPRFAAAQIAAIREAFEETGILLARRRGADELLDREAAAALGEYRGEMAKHDARFLGLMREANIELACDRLVLFAHWVAPPGLHRRFDTLFFAAACPPGQEATADDTESTEALWIAPDEAVDARGRGARKMIFPTVRNVELLAMSDCCEHALAFASRRKIAPITPALETRGDATFLTIPQSFGYPVTEEEVSASVRG